MTIRPMPNSNIEPGSPRRHPVCAKVKPSSKRTNAINPKRIINDSSCNTLEGECWGIARLMQDHDQIRETRKLQWALTLQDAFQREVIVEADFSLTA